MRHGKSRRHGKKKTEYVSKSRARKLVSRYRRLADQAHRKYVKYMTKAQSVVGVDRRHK
jgi:hypothetical protein